MSSTYGEHAERAARAVAGLVANPAVPITPQHQQAVLQARDILLAALRERLRSQFAIYVAATDPAAQRPARLDLLRTTPLTELGYVLEHFPRLPEEQRISPLEALTASTDPTAQRWVVAARELVLANHILDTAEAKPWQRDPASHAALAADTAQLIEALSVLDERLRAGGVLDVHMMVSLSSQSTRSVTAARLAAATVDKLAHWVADYSLLDVAATAPPRPVEHDQRVKLIQWPDEIVEGQRRLTSFLTPMALRNLRGPHRLSAETANVVARNQAVLLEQLQRRIIASTAPGSAQVRLETLRTRFGHAVYAVRGLHNATGARPQPLLLNQQREVSVAVHNGLITALNDQQALDLLSATETLLSTWATALGREVSRASTELRVGRRGAIDRPVYGRIRSDGPAGQALATLAALPTTPLPMAPGKPEEATATWARRLLRDHVANTPPLEGVKNWPGPGRRLQHRTPRVSADNSAPRRR